MRKWVPHCHVEDHQLLSRNRSIAAVGTAPVGERLDVLVDWSEKLSLEPNNSATGAQYMKIGLVVAVCVYRGAEGAKAETVAGICEKPINDVPHTHAFLKQVLKLFADRSREMGAVLGCVNIWSDGGQAHFKCAEAFVYNSHLLSFLRLVSGHRGARLIWNFMQSYHGKGPYDAEGGIIKYSIRRNIFKRGYAFLTGAEAHAFCCQDKALTCAIAKNPGTGKHAAFNIVRRTFIYVPESHVEVFKYCTSPLFSCHAAAGVGDLKSKNDIFCLRPDPNPAVVAFDARPEKLGLPPQMAPTHPTTTEPYLPETLNLVPGPDDAGFTGTWRHLSCSCNYCLFGDGDNTYSCSSYGPHVAAPWVPYKVCRKIPAATNISQPDAKQFIVKFLDFAIVRCARRGSTFDGAQSEIATFLMEALRMYKTMRSGSQLMQKRFRLPHWVKGWVVESYRELKLQGGEEIDLKMDWIERRTKIGYAIARIGWEPPPRDGGASMTHLERVFAFIDLCVNP